jgi:hypothetical protein
VVPRKSLTARVLNGLESEFLLRQFADFAQGQTPGHTVTVRPDRNIFHVELQGHWAVEMINVLYGNCMVALSRKLETARQILAGAVIPVRQSH